MTEKAEIDVLMATLEERERQSRRYVTAWMLVPVFFVAAFLVVGGYLLNKMNRELEAKKSQLNKLVNELEARQSHLNALGKEITSAEEALLSLNPLLREFGWTATRVPKDISGSPAIKQSLVANEVLRQTESHHLKPESLTVQYYAKDIDGEKVRSTLKSFGFRLEEKEPLLRDVPTNDIVFGGDVQPADAKIVAYVLIRAGIEIKGIHKSRLPAKSTAIQVLGNRLISSRSRLSVEQIQQMSYFELDPV